jgi:putative inorganic carbon (HCO3(-)) transporter
MVIEMINKLLKNWKTYQTALIIFSLCFFIGMLVPAIGYKNGYLLLGGIIYIGLLIYSFIKYEFGFYISLTFGFLIFILGRITSFSFPLGVLIELPLWLSCISLLIHKKSNNQIDFSISNHVITLFMIIFIVYSLIQLVNPSSFSFLAWLYAFRKVLMFGGIYFLALHLFISLKNINFFFKYWIGISFLAGIYGCIQQWFGFFNFEYYWVKSSQTRSQLFYLGGDIYRKFSVFSDPSAFGIGMATTTIISLILLIYTKSIRNWFFLSLINLFMLLGVGYSGTRTAYFIIIIGICFFILLTITKKNTLIFATISFLLFALLLFAPIYSNLTINRIRSTFEFSQDASMNVRNINREKIRPYIYAHPFGGGLSTSGGTGEQYTPGHKLAGFPTDSGYVRTAVETGWIGLIIQCAFYFFILNSGIKTFFNSRKRVLRIYLLATLACLFSFIVAQYSQESTDPTPLCFLFYSSLALIVRVDYINKRLIHT